MFHQQSLLTWHGYLCKKVCIVLYHLPQFAQLLLDFICLFDKGGGIGLDILGSCRELHDIQFLNAADRQCCTQQYFKEAIHNVQSRGGGVDSHF